MDDRWLFNEELELWIPYSGDPLSVQGHFPEPEDEHAIYVGLRDQFGVTIWYEMEIDLSLQILMTLYCCDTKKSLAMQKFYFNDNRIWPHQTPDQLNMSSGDYIDVYGIQPPFKEILEPDDKQGVSATVGIKESDDACKWKPLKTIPVPGAFKPSEVQYKLLHIGVKIQGCEEYLHQVYIQT